MYKCQYEWCEIGHEQWCSVKGGGCIPEVSLCVLACLNHGLVDSCQLPFIV